MKLLHRGTWLGFVMICAALGQLETAQGTSTNAARLSIGLLRGFPGGTVQVPVVLGNTGSVVAAQFDLNYPAAHLLPGSISPGNLGSNVTVRWRQVAPGVLRYVIYSPHNALLLTNAQVGTLPVGLPPGDTTGGRISPANVVLAAVDGSLIAPVAVLAGGVQLSPVFRAGDGTVSLLFSAQSNWIYVVQATTNFVNWVNISTNTAILNYFTLIDADAVHFPYRFYRAVPISALPTWDIGNPTLSGGGVFGFMVAGVTGKAFVVQISSNLTSWFNLSTNTLTAAPMLLSDPTSVGVPRRFYRLSLLP